MLPSNKGQQHDGGALSEKNNLYQATNLFEYRVLRPPPALWPTFLVRTYVSTLSTSLKTLVGLFGCVLDFFSEIRRWVVVDPAPAPTSGGGGGGGSSTRAAQEGGAESSQSAPSIVDLWAMQRLGLECSRVLGVWVAEDPESLPQRFLEVLPVLLALHAGGEVSGRG